MSRYLTRFKSDPLPLLEPAWRRLGDCRGSQPNSHACPLGPVSTRDKTIPAIWYPVSRRRRSRKMLSLRPPHTTFPRTSPWLRWGRLGGAAAPHCLSAAAPALARETAAGPGSVSFPILVRVPPVVPDVPLTCSDETMRWGCCLCYST